MDATLFEYYLNSRAGEGQLVGADCMGSAGGAACGDLVVMRVASDSDGNLRVGFDASGCGALTAAASAAAELATGESILHAAGISTRDISNALGTLSPAKLHAAELVCDALHRALGQLVMKVQLEAPARERTLVAMSGGVDSAVAAWICAQTTETVGVTVELWRDSETDAEASCCSHVAVRRARQCAHERGLPHFTLDLRTEFSEGVVDPWLAGYANGETPNPCVTCNGNVRIAPMIELASRIGAETLATGHYAQLVESDDARGPLLKSGTDLQKDQAYALIRVPSEVLARLQFPLGGMSKVEVRQIARDANLAPAEQPDSQDLCFLAGIGREGFLKRHGKLGDRPGAIVSKSGDQVGTHRGTHHHTVGQRRGLGLGGGTPLYVIETDAVANTVVVGPRESLVAGIVQLRDVELRREPERVSGIQLRHRAKVGGATVVSCSPDGAIIEVESGIERVAVGQVACLLDGDTVVGCGTVAGFEA